MGVPHTRHSKVEQMPEELVALYEQLKRAIAREHTVRTTHNAGSRELKQLRKERDGIIPKPRPSALESATAKGMWGFDEYLRAAEKESENIFLAAIELAVQHAVVDALNDQLARANAQRAREIGTVVIETEPTNVDVRVKRRRKINKTL